MRENCSCSIFSDMRSEECGSKDCEPTSFYCLESDCLYPSFSPEALWCSRE